MGGGGACEPMKQRVNRCLNKLSDRDTEAMAANELESIARSLTPDALPPFLSAISDTRPTDKTPLRRQSLRLISLISNSHPAASIAPHLPRMLSAALRRLRDPDSSVRAACVDAVRSISAAAPAGAVAGVLLRPLADALLHEQDQNAQISAALCLAAAVDAAGANPDLAHHLQKLLPRLVKLVRSNAFKAKAALISLLSSVAAAGGATAPALVGVLVPCLVEFLASEDWAARKAAAEALSVLAVSEKDLLVGFKSSCISSFESRRFDKVKIVRDSMNRMIDVWKEIPVTVDSESNSTSMSKKSQSNASSRESGSDGRHQAASLSPSSVRSVSPFIAKKSRFSSSRSPPPDASPIKGTRKAAPSIRNKKLSPPLSHSRAKASDWKVEISVANTPVKVVNEDKLQREKGGLESNVRSRLETRRMLFEKNSDEKGNMLVGLKTGARVVPCQENEILESTAEADDITNELNAGHKDGDLSLIRMQLVQIENQQSSLLDLLQRFIGSSQNGIHSLETRVHGLEMALDDISRDLVAPSGRMANNNDPEVNTCCRLPGTEFLSGKFWRRHEERYSSRFSISDIQNLPEERRALYKWDKQRFGPQGGVVVNPLAEINPQSRATPDIAPQRMKSGNHDTGNIHAQDGRKQDLAPHMIRTA